MPSDSLHLLPLHRRQVLRGTAGLGLTLGLGLTSTAQAQVTSLNDAINKAGRQRMLSQRMAKAWLALGQGVDTRRAEKIMGDSMALFDRQLVELKSYAPNPEVRGTYMALESAWSDYKAALVGQAPDRSATGLVLGLDAKVLKLAHQGTVQLEQLSSKPAGRLVNVAGRQRMLSQRTAKFYLSQRWGAQVADAAGEMEKARQEFRTALSLLYQAPQATTAIREHLTLAEQQWVFFENALSRLKEPAGAQRRAEEVFSTSENILMVMDKVTGLYAQLT